MPADDRALEDLAARFDEDEKRVDRLETLEFGTLAFPSGGVVLPICDIILAAPAAAVTFCPAPGIPGTEKHLWAIMHYYSTLSVNTTKAELNFNGDFGPVYLNYTRQETPVGPPFITDTEVPPVLPWGRDTKISLPIAAPTNSPAIETPTLCMLLVPGYARTTNMKSCAWWGNTNLPDDPNTMSGDQGGGEWRRPFESAVAPVAITSITMTHGGAGSFAIGSHFTLYSLP